MQKEKLRQKKNFIIRRLTKLSLLPTSKDMMNEKQKEIYQQIESYNFDYWEEVKRQNGWDNNQPADGRLSDKRAKVRTYFRNKGILPPYGEPMNEEQQAIWDQISNNDFSLHQKMVDENVKKTNTPKYKIPKSPNYKNDEAFTKTSLPKMVSSALRRLQILPPLNAELTQEQTDIFNDVMENWFGKKKSYFIHKYLHLSTPEGRLLYRLHKSHQDFGFNFNLEHSDIIIPKFCPILGIELSTNPKDKDNPNYYTGDRIDSSKGLVKGNIQVMSMRANKMKSKATELELIQFATNALKLFGDVQ